MNAEPSSAFRTLPHNVEAEKALLGAIFANQRAYEKVADFLRPEHFAVLQHGTVFAEAAKLIEAGKAANPISLRPIFLREDMQEIGGLAYSIELAESVVSIINAGEYGRIIHDTAQKRVLIGLGEELIDRGYTNDVEDTHKTILEDHEQALTALGGDERKDATPEAQMDSTMKGIEAVFRGEQPPGVETGLADLDRMLGRIRNQDLCIIAGRPSMGKTVLAINIAEKAADSAPVLFFSLEMSAEQLNQRRLANKAQVSITGMRTPKGMGQPEMDKVIDTSHTLAGRPFLIDDTPALTISSVRRRARRQKRKGLGAIVVDYLQLMTSEDSRKPKVYQVEEITNGAKALAKELDIPVIVLSQLSRAVEQRDVKRPTLSDLRDSGSIEQDADIVLMLYREEYYLNRDKPGQRENETDDKFRDRCERYKIRLEKSRNKAEIIVAKQRQGPTGTVMAHFDGPHMRFANEIKEDLY